MKKVFVQLSLALALIACSGESIEDRLIEKPQTPQETPNLKRPKHLRNRKHRKLLRNRKLQRLLSNLKPQRPLSSLTTLQRRQEKSRYL